MSASDFMAQGSDADMMDVSDHAGASTTANQSIGQGSPTRSLVMAWIVSYAIWWALHFAFKGQLT